MPTKQKLSSVYAIRCTAIGPGYSDKPGGIKSPFVTGAFMAEYHNDYAGRSMCTARSLEHVTFYGTRKAAEELLAICNEYNAEFEIVEFMERTIER